MGLRINQRSNDRWRDKLFWVSEKQGYAVSSGETLEGAISISVPIRGYFCPVALSIFGPKFRFETHLMDCREKMEKSAKRISKKIAMADINV